MELLQDSTFQGARTEPATNSDLLDYTLDLIEQAKAQNARNAELRKQLQACGN